MRTTVAIPLFRSHRWRDVVAGNLTRLAGVAQLVVSDVTGDDATLGDLRERFRTRDDIAWLGPRACAPGWVAHCNDLQARCDTEFFQWLPHDDEVGADWVSLGEAALDRTPSAVLAVGELRAISGGGAEEHPGYQSSLTRGLSDPDRNVRVAEAIRLCVEHRSALSLAFRGVMRRATCLPLPAGGPHGAWADVLWAVSMLARGSFVPIAAVYGKRLYDGNTHRSWPRLGAAPALRTEFIPGALRELPADVRERLLTQAWSVEVERLRRIATERDAAIQRSWSWRLTSPLRLLGDARRLRRQRTGP